MRRLLIFSLAIVAEVVAMVAFIAWANATDGSATVLYIVAALFIPIGGLTVWRFTHGDAGSR
ncbi:hypothetical protein VR010_09680 [Actinomycetaceae bacterium L2_0104]